MGRLIAIDLGATFAVVTGIGPTGRPVVLRDRERRRSTAAVVSFEGGGARVGRAGQHPGGMAALAVARFVSCAYGDPAWRFTTPDGQALRSVEVGALILRRLAEDAERALGTAVTDAVLTVPACFDDTARRSALEAGRIAGLTVRRLLNQPTAAAIGYAAESAVEGAVVVYALGGGAFDATVLRIADRRFEVLATRGDPALGGLDWDNVLMRMVNRRFRADGGPDLLRDRLAEAGLRAAVEAAKCRLGAADRTGVRLSSAGVDRTIPVTRIEFEEATAILLGRTRELTQLAVADARLGWSQVDRVVLAGGSTRMPMVVDMLRHLTGRRPEGSAEPGEIAAKGAAIYGRGVLAADAADLPPHAGPPVQVREVASYGLGTLARDAASGALRNVVVLPANTPLPASGRSLFSTIDDGQTRIELDVTQGDDVDPLAVRRLDRVSFAVPAYPAGAPIEVVYGYDADQFARLEVTDASTGRVLGRTEVRNNAVLGPSELAAAAARTAAMALD